MAAKTKTDKPNSRAILDESVRRELQKRGLASAPRPQPAKPERGIISGLQDDARFAMDQFANPLYWRDFTLPGIGSLNLELMSGIQSAATGALDPLSPAGRLLINRAYQGVNPFAAGEVGNEALESNPEMLKGARELAESIGDTPAAMAQFGAQLLPGIALEAGAGSLVGAAETQLPRAYTTLRQAIPEVGMRAVKAGATSAVIGAGQEALGAREGDRLNALGRGLANPLYWALGAAPAGAAAIGEIRSGNAAALADIRQPRVDEATAQVNSLLEQERRIAEIGRGNAIAAAKRGRIQENIKALLEQEKAASDRSAGMPTQPMDGPTIEGRLGLDTLLQMEPVDRGRYLAGQADDALARMRTVVDPELGEQVRQMDSPIDLNPPELAPNQQPGRFSPPAFPEDLPTIPMRGLIPAERLGIKADVVGPFADAAGGGKVNPRGAHEAKTRGGDDFTTQKLGPVRPNSPEASAALPSVAPELAQTKIASFRELGAAMDENPALIREQIYGPGSQNMGAARAGTDTQVLSHDQIRAEQAARGDSRTVETPRDTPIPPGGLPKDVDVPGAASQDAAYAASKMQETRNPNILQELAKKTQLPENRAVPLVSAAIRGFKAAEHIHNVMTERLFPKLNKIVKAMTPEERKLTRMFIEQNLSPVKDDPSIPVEVLPREFRELFEQGMDQNRTYRNDLVKAGYFSPEQIKSMEKLEKQGYQWLHRDYRAFMDKGYVPDRALLDRAIRWTVAKSKGKLTYESAANELITLMTGGGDVHQRYRQSRLNKEILKTRAQIPPIIRDVLGKIKDPAYVVANSMSEVERLWRQHKVSQAFTDPDYKGVVWDDKPSKAMAPDRIWNENMTEFENKRTYGEFAGKYVAPQLYESIMQGPTPVMRSTLQRVMAWISGAFKTAKVALSPVTYMNNWISNSAYAAAAGLPVWNARFAPRLTQAAKAMVAYGDTFTTPKGRHPTSGDGLWMQWALEDGALIAGTGAEFGGAQAKKIAEQFLRQKQDGLIGWLDTGWNWMGRQKAKLGGVYDALDSHWRLAVYIEQVTKGRERLGLPLDEARARASRIVNENFASSGSVGQGVREMSNQVGFLAPFMTWHADNLRVHYNWMKNAGRGLKPLRGDGSVIRDAGTDILSGEGSGQALNVALHYGLIGGLFEGLRRLYNWSDQETAVAEASLKSGYKTNNPGPVRQWLPWRDAKGRAQVVSLVPLMPSAMFLKGNPKESLLSRAFQATTLGFVQGGAAEDPTRRALSMLGMGEDSFKPEVLPGQEGRAMMEAAWNYIEPGLVRDVRNVLRRTETAGVARRFEEPYTAGQAAMAFTPLKTEPVGRQSQESERRREVGQMRETSGDMRQVNRLSETPATKANLRRAVGNELRKRAKERSQRSKDIRGGK